MTAKTGPVFEVVPGTPTTETGTKPPAAKLPAPAPPDADEISVYRLEDQLQLKRQSLMRSLEESGLAHVRGVCRRRALGNLLWDAVRLLSDSKSAGEQRPADRRNLAQAKLAEIEGARKQGTLVDRGLVGQLLADTLSVVRDQMRQVVAKAPKSMRAKMREDMARAMDTLAADLKRLNETIGN